jgi:hypothetical protein
MPWVGVEADVIDMRHVIQDVSGPATDIEDAFVLAKLQEFPETNPSQPVCTEEPLRGDVKDWRTQLGGLASRH